MNLRQIEVLHAILSAGSVTGAALLLHISQPAVSKVLQQIERQFGFALFARERGRLQPTREALALFTEIRELQPRLDAIRRLADNLRAGEGEQLRIAALPSLAQTLLPRAIARWAERQPGLRVSLAALHTRELVGAILLQDADIGFDFGGVAHPAIRRAVLKQTQVVCAAPRGWFADETCLIPEIARARPLVQPMAGDPLDRLLQSQADGAWSDWHGTLSAQSYHSALSMVSLGMGATLLDPYTAASADPQTVSVHTLHPPIDLALEMSVPLLRPLSAVAERFVSVLTRVDD